MYDHVMIYSLHTFYSISIQIKERGKNEPKRLSILNKVVVKGFVVGHRDRSVGKVTPRLTT